MRRERRSEYESPLITTRIDRRIAVYHSVRRVRIESSIARRLIRPRGARRRACPRIEGQVVEPERRRPLPGPAAEQRADPGQELLERERLRHVVVGAEVEAGHLVGDAVPG